MGGVEVPQPACLPARERQPRHFEVFHPDPVEQRALDVFD
jgi:hypothetical protein